jgi:hypothetical protein
MKKTIWYMHKPGEERDYAMTTLPSPEWAKLQHAQGFELYAVEIDVPTLTPTTGTLQGHAHRTVLAALPVEDHRTPEQLQRDGDAPG